MSRWERHIFDTLPLPISKGEVNDHSVVFLSGKNPNVLTSNLPETVWNVGGRSIPEKTDIDNVVRFVTSNGTRVYSNQQLLLVNNNALHN